jgi:indole-3-glycerol phosphate synthase
MSINPDILGINNRCLRTFEVALDTTLELKKFVEPGTLIVTESGIHAVEDIVAMRNKGVHAFLVGEAFMRCADPGEKLRELFF